MRHVIVTLGAAFAVFAASTAFAQDYPQEGDTGDSEQAPANQQQSAQSGQRGQSEVQQFAGYWWYQRNDGNWLVYNRDTQEWERFHPRMIEDVMAASSRMRRQTYAAPQGQVYQQPQQQTYYYGPRGNRFYGGDPRFRGNDYFWYGYQGRGGFNPGAARGGVLGSELGGQLGGQSGSAIGGALGAELGR